MDRIYFGDNDSGGPESLTSEAIRFSQGGAEWAEMILGRQNQAPRRFRRKSV